MHEIQGHTELEYKISSSGIMRTFIQYKFKWMEQTKEQSC